MFNHELALDLMWIEENPILHVMDTHTHFQSAYVLRSKRAEDIWFAFVEFWAALYVGYAQVIHLGQEASFQSSVFNYHAAANCIELQFSGIESHNSIGPGERYHAPFRSVFLVMRESYPRIEPEVLLRYALKEIIN